MAVGGWMAGWLPATRGRMALAGVAIPIGVPQDGLMPRVARAEVSVRQSADPSTVKVGESALAGARCGEVDTCVVQVEASLILV
jgi:hypothetical protein